MFSPEWLDGFGAGLALGAVVMIFTAFAMFRDHG